MSRKKAAGGFTLSIKPEPNKFHDNLLNVVGNTFKFDHPKGLAEWLKNSADAYATRAVHDDAQFIILRFKLGNPKSTSEFECIDFVGCTKADIDEALKIWGSPTAAKKGTNIATFGGHGNGGKFYMRQMFRTAIMVTYQRGLLNVFGFDEQHRYGFDKKNTDRAIPLQDALKFAQIDELDIPEEVRARWKSNRKAAGFSVVRGIRPQRFSGRSTIETILEGLRLHPQARRLLRHKRVIVVEHGQSWGKQLDPPSVDPKDGFTTPREIPLPKMFVFGDLKVQTRTATQRRPQLILRTSNQPLPRLREHSSLNTIDIIGEVGCIGSYRMNELGYLRHAAETEFIYGECECAFLEQDGLDCVSNDREKLVKNELTDELLDWVGQQVDGLAAEIAEKRRQEKKSRDLVHSSLFNQMLDRWKNKFMATLSVELFGGSGLGSAFGGSGTGATGAGRGASDGGAKLDGDGEADDVKQPLGGEDAGHQGGDQGGSGEDRRKGAKFPTVLISGLDRDPFDPDASAPFDCDERHPPVYQRQVDIDRGVYWINTSRPLANKILNLYGADHPRWREYLFQRYVEIILKQQIYSLQRHEAEFTAEQVDSLIDRVTAMVHDAAAEELEGFLFDETLTGAAAAQSFDATEGEDDDAN